MSLARELAHSPDAELLDVLSTLPDASRSSGSTVVHEREFADGSALTITSVQGSEAHVHIKDDQPTPPPPAPLPPGARPPTVGQLWPRWGR